MTTTGTEAAAAQVARSWRRQRLRRWVTPLLALVPLVLLPLLLVHQFRVDDQLRRTQPVVDAVVTSVQVHHGKNAHVDVDVRTASGTERVVGGGLSTRHPPAVGQHLDVVVDPAHTDHALLARTSQTLTGTITMSVLVGLLVAVLVLFVGWCAGVPRGAALVALGDAQEVHDVAVRAVRRGRPPLSGLFTATHAVRGSRFAEVEVELPGGETLSSWYLLRRKDLEPGSRVAAVGRAAPGGWLALVDGRVRWPYLALSAKR